MSPQMYAPTTAPTPTTAVLVRRLHRLDLMAARLAARKAQIVQQIARAPASNQTPEDAAQLHANLSLLYDIQGVRADPRTRRDLTE